MAPHLYLLCPLYINFDSNQQVAPHLCPLTTVITGEKSRSNLYNNSKYREKKVLEYYDNLTHSHVLREKLPAPHQL